MLFAIAFVVLFTIGGFSGLMLAITPADFQYHDTYFVVAHFIMYSYLEQYFQLWLQCITGFLNGVEICMTKDRSLALLAFFGVNVTFFPQHFIGLAGMPRGFLITRFSLRLEYGIYCWSFLVRCFSNTLLFIVVRTVMGGRRLLLKSGRDGFRMDS